MSVLPVELNRTSNQKYWRFLAFSCWTDFFSSWSI